MIVISGVILFVGSFQVIEAQPNFCASCHEMKFYYDTWTKSTHHSEADCLSCHTEPGLQGFIDAKVRGITELIAHITGRYEFPIPPRIRVKNPQCLRCHADAAEIQDISLEARHDIHIYEDVLCAECHSKLVHILGNESRVIDLTMCDDCHNHEEFSIKEKHTSLSCGDCHPYDVYQNVSGLCQDCHDVPQDHVEGVYSNCEACHSETGWSMISFDHITIALKGGHSNLACLDCHQPDTYSGLSPNCESCHDLPKPHVDIDSQNCVDCHIVNAWSPAEFDHSFYELTESHRIVSCKECHNNEQYEGTSTLCEDCHEAPVNHGVDINAKCERCHTTSEWSAVTFDHSIFSLTEGHSDILCIDCHQQQTYGETSSLCEDCHNAPINHAVNIDSQCEQCHTITGWTPAFFDHDTYQLTGAHQFTPCLDCHTGSIFEGTTRQCVNCHSEPRNHLGLSTVCSQCHTTTSFSSSTYRHPRIEEHYPSGEKRLDCTDCHRTTYASYSCTGAGCHSSNTPRDD